MILYDMIFEIKSDLNEKEVVKVETVNDEVNIIHHNDRISCIDGIMTIHRKNSECIIVLKYVTRVWRGVDVFLL